MIYRNNTNAAWTEKYDVIWWSATPRNYRKTEHFKALAKNDSTSAIADHVKTTGPNIKWYHFYILASGKSDYHCKIKETLFIQELKPASNVNVSSEKLMPY